jgi:hypothetical protein
MTDPAYGLSSGFSVPYLASLYPIELNPALLPPLCKVVREVCGRATPPEGRPNCRNCKKVEELLKVAGVDPTKATASMAFDAMRGMFATVFRAA